MQVPTGIPVSIRTPTLLLAASLAANAGLVALILVKAPAVFQISSYRGGTVVSPSPEAAAAPANASGNKSVAAMLAGLDKGDLAAMVARLRAAGASRSLIKALVEARVRELFRARRRELVDQVKIQPYWDRKFGRLDPKFIDAANALGKEQNEMVKELMGPGEDDSDDPVTVALMRMQEGGMSHEGFTRAQSIKSDYGEMESEVYSKVNGPMLPEDIAKIAYLEKEEQADIQKALSPEEFEEYQMRNSQMSSYLRNTLQAFSPSEDEFKELYKVESDFDQQYGSPFTAMTQDQMNARQAHQADLTAAIQQALGPDRYTDYKEQTNPDYVNTSNLVDRLGLPATATQDITSVQNDITKRADAIQSNTSLSEDDRLAQLAALGDEANTKLTAVLGDNGMAAYRQGPGWWLFRLKPKGK